MILENLIIESTRKCNMACEHCLRGNAQNKNITYEIIKHFLTYNDITDINVITFTGGEPSLNPQSINDFISICKNNSIECGNFYIATNGKKYNPEFILSVIELYNFCTDNEVSSLDISKSDFHIDQDEDTLKKLHSLSFCNDRLHIDYTNVIPEGKGKHLNYLNGINNNQLYIEPLRIYDDIVEGEIYLNVKGDICTCCDLSYHRQNFNKIGNVFTKSLREMIEEQENFQGET